MAMAALSKHGDLSVELHSSLKSILKRGLNIDKVVSNTIKHRENYSQFLKPP